MLEHLVDLLNIVNEPEYCAQLVKENVYSDNKVIQTYLDALASGEPDDAIVSEVSGLLTDIKARDKQKEMQLSLIHI